MVSRVWSGWSHWINGQGHYEHDTNELGCTFSFRRVTTLELHQCILYFHFFLPTELCFEFVEYCACIKDVITYRYERRILLAPIRQYYALQQVHYD